MDPDLESMVICAVRYCIGRQSYIVGDGIAWARKYGRLSKHARDTLIRDIAAAGAGGTLIGADFDDREWRSVLAELQSLPTPTPGASDAG